MWRVRPGQRRRDVGNAFMIAVHELAVVWFADAKEHMKKQLFRFVGATTDADVIGPDYQVREVRLDLSRRECRDLARMLIRARAQVRIYINTKEAK